MSTQTVASTRVSGLSPVELRVLGCLLEKQRTTPDAYPLSLNGLRLACNQSTNRDPVVDYDEQTIREGLHRLERRGCVRLASGAGSRAAKYRHLLAEVLPLTAPEQAVLTTLMLRGPQTPGELKQRSERMHTFADLAAVHETLQALIGRGLAVALERRPGHKEERYAQLLGEGAGEGAEAHEAERSAEHPVEGYAPAPHPVTGHTPSTGQGGQAAPTAPREGAHAAGTPRLDQLAERVEQLEREVAQLRAAMRHPV